MDSRDVGSSLHVLDRMFKVSERHQVRIDQYQNSVWSKSLRTRRRREWRLRDQFSGDEKCKGYRIRWKRSVEKGH